MKSTTTRVREAVVNHRLDVPLKTLLMAAAVVGGCWIAVHLIPVFIVIVVALMLAASLLPLVDWLEKRRVGRAWGIGIVFGALLLAIAAFGALTVPPLFAQARALVEAAPGIRDRVVQFLAGSPATATLARSVARLDYGVLASGWAQGALDLSRQAFELVVYGVTTLFLALYVMVDRDRLRGALFAVVPRHFHIRLSRVLMNMEVIVGGYIRGQLLTSLLMFAFTFVLLLACRVPNALALAAFAGIADVLPYVGVVLSVGPAVAAAGVRGPVVVGIVLVAMLAYEELESRYLVPRIYGGALKLPSSVVLVALLVGGTLGGIAGALLALPIAAAIRMLIEELRVELPGEQVVDAEVRLRDDEAEEEYERRAEGEPAAVAAGIAVSIVEERRDDDTAAAAAVEKAAEP